jgi:hypothetical protein
MEVADCVCESILLGAADVEVHALLVEVTHVQETA